MGKKTKRQKIVAEERRKAFVPSSPQRPQTPSLYIYPVQLLRKDLTKTFVLSILAVSLEIALYLVLEKKLVLPFKIVF